jgi:hypothetical protein
MLAPLSKGRVGQISEISTRQYVEIDLIFPVYRHLSQEVAADHVPIEAMCHKILLELIQSVI